MEVSTFSDDLFDLFAFADRLEKFIKVEHQFVEGSLVIALSSKYGSGKTTFFRMWKADMESREEESERPMVVDLNAWESDYHGDPLFAIISSFAEVIEETGESADSLISAAKDVGWFATAIGGQIAKKFSGVDAVAAGDLAEKKRSAREGRKSVPMDAFTIYQRWKEAMSRLKSSIREFVDKSESDVLFLIDELDRCRPDYAITYLETIKHIFDVQGAVFILAADREQLENSAKTAFGPGLDFEEYYRKFVHREVTLPPISDVGYGKLASEYVTCYLQRDGLRNCFMKLDYHEVRRISEFVAALKLTPRQIQEMFRILGHVLETTEENRGRIFWSIAVGSMVMAAFKVGNPRIFHLLGSERFEPQEAKEYLTDLLAARQVEWWFTLFLTGGGLRVSKDETEEEVMTKVGLIKEGEQSRQLNQLGDWHEGWGHEPTGRFAQIHEKIEQVSQWN